MEIEEGVIRPSRRPRWIRCFNQIQRKRRGIISVFFLAKVGIIFQKTILITGIILEYEHCEWHIMLLLRAQSIDQ